jgi:hypothetical protein
LVAEGTDSFADGPAIRHPFFWIATGKALSAVDFTVFIVPSNVPNLLPAFSALMPEADW